MASVDEVVGGTLGELNIGLATASVILPSLSAQLDVLIGSGLGPLKFDLAAQLNGALAAQLSITAQLSDPLSAIRAALQAVAQLQASLSAALTLPPINLTLSAELSAVATLAGTLSARLGLIEGMIRAALAVKLPAINFGEDITAALGVGPAILLAFDGITDGTNMAAMGDLIRTKLQSPVTFGGDTIQPTDNVSGVLILTTAGSAYTAMAQIFGGL
jgi:hypothetical protein